jgi:hypothetical protein
MRSLKFLLSSSALALSLVANSHAAFIVEPDIDGSIADDGGGNQLITYSPNFSFGNGGTTTSDSVAGTAAGLTGGDSIFGGDGTPGDQYVYSYTPGVDADNATFSSGQDLGNGNSATGLAGGASGLYNVYATWPTTNNISNSGQSTTYSASSDAASADLVISQDTDNNGGIGNVWVLIGTVELTAGTTYTVTQTAPDSSFVSMRSSGVMWERAIPEPSSLLLLSLGVLGVIVSRRCS